MRTFFFPLKDESFTSFPASSLRVKSGAGFPTSIFGFSDFPSLFPFSSAARAIGSARNARAAAKRSMLFMVLSPDGVDFRSILCEPFPRGYHPSHEEEPLPPPHRSGPHRARGRAGRHDRRLLHGGVHPPQLPAEEPDLPEHRVLEELHLPRHGLQPPRELLKLL